MDLLNYVPSAVNRDGAILDPGRYDVIIAQVKVVTDRQKNLQGEMKTAEELAKKKIDWKDSQQQLAVVFSQPGKGVITERFNTVGFMRYEELADTTGHYASSYEEPYAINEDSGERVPDPDRSSKALNIINELFDAVEVEAKDGEWIKLVQFTEDDEGNKTIVANIKDGDGLREPNTSDLIGSRLNVSVVAKEYGGRQVSSEVKHFRRWGFTPASKGVQDMASVIAGADEDTNF